MSITGPQCRAARALVQWSREVLSADSGVRIEMIADLETGRAVPSAGMLGRLRTALEEAEPHSFRRAARAGSAYG
jgi:transcriptional regulator with XRE-family HTH domain